MADNNVTRVAYRLNVRMMAEGEMIGWQPKRERSELPPLTDAVGADGVTIDVVDNATDWALVRRERTWEEVQDVGW